MIRTLMTIALGAPMLVTAGGCTKVETDPDYIVSIDAWHAARVERLRMATGWLSLVGLYPLEPGEQTFGSDASNAIVFPSHAPAHAGTLRLEDGRVTLVTAPDVLITREGTSIDSIEMIPDTQPGRVSLDLGSMQFQIIERVGRFYVRLKDRDSDVRKNFTGIDRFPVDARWRFQARWVPYDPVQVVMVPNVLGYESEETCYGAVEFEIDGKTYRLEPSGTPENGLFVVFGDATNEYETYGGGRFLYTDPVGSDSILWLDFNKSYNPPCVFTPYATCPLPRAENVLPIRVEAGEKMWGDAH